MAHKLWMVLLFSMVSFWTKANLEAMQENYCYMKDPNPYVYFGAKTAYENIHGSLSHLPGCGIIFMWGLIRHGTRYGGPEYASTIKNIDSIKKEIIENHQNHKRGKLCLEDIQNLKKWTFNWSENMNYELVPQGKIDMTNLAMRLRATFPEFYDMTKENFTFKTSSKARCQKSSIAFTKEFLNNTASDLVENNISIDDKFLRILENKLDGDHIPEILKLKQADYVQNMLNEVGIRLGYEKNLSYSFVKDLYIHCAYENAWIPHSRPGFCAAFTKDHLKILEYAADLEDYYSQGYGDKKNMKRSCSILNDLFEKFKNARFCRYGSPIGAFYFAHSETLLPTFAQLGLFHDDEILKHNKYETLGQEREWRTSFMDSFASNLIVVLYRCSGEFKIVFYVSEKVIAFPGCADEGCSVSSFEEIFKNRILKSCTRSQSSSNRAASLSAFIFFTITYFLKYFQL